MEPTNDPTVEPTPPTLSPSASPTIYSETTTSTTSDLGGDGDAVVIGDITELADHHTTWGLPSWAIVVITAVCVLAITCGTAFVLWARHSLKGLDLYNQETVASEMV